MIRTAFHIAFLYIRQTFSSRSVLISSFLMPLLFTFVIAQAIPAGSADADAEPVRWDVNAVDEDGSDLSVALLDRLGQDPALRVHVLAREAALAQIEAEEVPVAVIIPAGAGEALRNGDVPTIRLHVTPNADQIAQVVQQAVQTAGSQVAGSVSAAQVAVRVAAAGGVLPPDVSMAQRQSYFAQSFARAEQQWQEAVPVAVSTQVASRATRPQELIPGGTRQTAPGMLVMFTLFFTIGGGIALLSERETGTLRRLLVMPIDKATILFGKLLGIFLAGLVQIIVLIGAGALLFNVDWGQSPVALVLVVLSFALAATSLGILMAALARTTAQANALSTIVVLAISALGGAWWPLEIVPPWMQTVGHVFPTAWAMDGFNNIITRGLGVEAILSEVLILLGYAGIFFAIGIWRFRYE